MPGPLRRLVAQAKARLALAMAPTHGLQGEIHERSLSFKNPQVESGFTESRRSQLETCVAWSALLVVFCGVFYTCFWHRYWDVDQYQTHEMYSVSRVQCAVQIGCFGTTLFGLCLSLVLSRRRAIGVYGLELGTVCSVAVTQAHTWVGVKYYIARLCSVSDPSELWGLELGGSDSGVLMWNCACLAAMFVMAPIRWKVLVLSGVSSVLNYAMPSFLVGSPDMRLVPANLFSLIILVLLHCYGKRHDELKERELHWRLLREKTLRCQAEFALSQRGTPVPSSRQVDAAAFSDARASSTKGPPSTTGSGQIFEKAFRKKGAVALKGLMELGRKEQWLIEADEVRLLPDGQLGSGGFGVVTEGTYEGVAVAVKRPKSDMYGTVRSVTIRELCNELRILRRLRHPNIVFLYGAVLNLEGELELSLVLELIEGVALSRFLCQTSRVEDSLKVQLMLNVNRALCYLHSRQPVIVHGDLKADNIFVERMVDGAHCAKLLDFGLSRVITRKARKMGGTLRWMAPELLDGERAERAPHREADVFSFGRVLFFGVTGLLPFHDKRGESLDTAVRQAARLSWPQAQQEPSLAQSCKRLVEQCTFPEPGARPSADEVHRRLEDISAPYLRVGPPKGPQGPRASRPRAPRPAGPESSGSDWSTGTGGGSPGAGPTVRMLASVPEEAPAIQDTFALQPDSPKGSEAALMTKQEGRAENVISATTNDTRGPTPKEVPAIEDVLVPPVSPKGSEGVGGGRLESAFFTTPQETRLLLFQTALWRCYRPTPLGSCCPHHAGLGELDAMRRELAARACSADGPPIAGQCQDCGCLAFKYDFDYSRAEECEFCEGQVALQDYPSPRTPTAGQSSEP